VTVHALPEFVDGNNANTDPVMDTPEFDVTMTVTLANGTAPASGYFVAGDTPMVTVTLKNHSDGTDVASSVYTTLSTDASSAKGYAGGGLSGATLYVYGPRDLAAPVLTLNAANDRGEDLLLPSSDPNVTTDATGYHYMLQPIPAGMINGTYIASVQMSDYGVASSDPLDYVTTSVGKVLFQIGTADVTAKASGDACADCHGDTRMHLTGAHPHNLPFDTDYCNACHDTTGNHGNPIGNRVHAVHSANSDGDLGSHSSYDWAEVNFPQDVSNCKACHNSGGTSYLTGYHPAPCFGCHGDSTNGNVTWDHMLQNGAQVLDQRPNFK
jgi:hypothetical protein